ncbi:hypothetical protein [Roseovarius autotrophicus]|uniref:hypothetical protein n=1 Tax=Roseovarius autotrophicus TaxID=2824121 RepID=UPI0019FF1BE9|nr:hypothetical protein [Roseovarius autotrophicus]MBE0453100.1 hypothetical protein [Roseovarius sp.]
MKNLACRHATAERIKRAAIPMTAADREADPREARLPFGGARPLGLLDPGMAVVGTLRPEDMPLMVIVDIPGNPIHKSGPVAWRST